MRHRLPQFHHLFSSDAYSAGYYTYLWSETMDADTWAAFEGRGVGQGDRRPLSQDLLSTGNETDRAEAYRPFPIQRSPPARFPYGGARGGGARARGWPRCAEEALPRAAGP